MKIRGPCQGPDVDSMPVHVYSLRKRVKVVSLNTKLKLFCSMEVNFKQPALAFTLSLGFPVGNTWICQIIVMQ